MKSFLNCLIVFMGVLLITAIVKAIQAPDTYPNFDSGQFFREMLVLVSVGLLALSIALRFIVTFPEEYDKLSPEEKELVKKAGKLLVMQAKKHPKYGPMIEDAEKIMRE